MEYFNQAVELAKQAKSRVESELDKVGGTEMEVKVKQATSMDNWPCPQSKLYEIAIATNDYTLYREIMPLMWKRLNESSSWRIIYKTTILCEALLKHGSEKCIDELRDRIYNFRQLSDFHATEDGKDRGSGVREKCKQLVQLLSNHEQLKQARAEASKLKDKYVGVSNRGDVNSYNATAGGYGQSDFGGSASSSYAASSGGGGGATGAYDADRRGSTFDSQPSGLGGGDSKPKKKKRGSKSKHAHSKHESEEEQPPEVQSPASDLQLSPDEEELARAKKEKKKKKKDRAAASTTGDDTTTDAADTTKDKKKSKKKNSVVAGVPMIGGVLAPPPPAGQSDASFDDAAFGSFGSSSAAAPQSNAAVSSSFDMFDTLAQRSQPSAAPAKPAAAASSMSSWDQFETAPTQSSSAKPNSAASFDLFASSPPASSKQSNGGASIFDSFPAASSSNKPANNTSGGLLDNFTSFQSTSHGSNAASSSTPAKPAPNPNDFLSSALEVGLVNLNLGGTGSNPLSGTKQPQQSSALRPIASSGTSSLNAFDGLMDSQPQTQAPRLSYNGFPQQQQQQFQQPQFAQQFHQPQPGFGRFPQHQQSQQQQHQFGMQQGFGQQGFGQVPQQQHQQFNQPQQQQFNQQQMLSSFAQNPPSNLDDVFFK